MRTPRLTDTTTILHPGDVVVLYTDGVTEARRDGDFFDDDRLLAAIGRLVGTGAQEMAVVVVRVP